MKTLQVILEEFDEKKRDVILLHNHIFVLPVDWVKSFLHKALIQQQKEMKEKIEKMIVDEILICHQENTPTSRLTSLAMKVKDSIK